VVTSAIGSSSAQPVYGCTTSLYFSNDGKAAYTVAEKLKKERAHLNKEIYGKIDNDEQERYALPLKILPHQSSLPVRLSPKRSQLPQVLILIHDH